MAELHKFEVVEEPDQAEPVERAGFSMLVLGLKTLSQRTLAAIADLFFIASIFGTWWLWHAIPDPNVNQIVALSIFALFTLSANWLVRRK